jgi:hypothetical protein
MTGDKAIRCTTIAAVAVVALVAASVSYRHALDVVGQHGESGWLDKVYPLTVDGLIYPASMALLNDARRGLKPAPAGLRRARAGDLGNAGREPGRGPGLRRGQRDRRGVASAGPGRQL